MYISSMRKCSTCKIEKSDESFRKDKSRKDGIHKTCNECNSKLQRKWYANNKLKARETALLSYYKNIDAIKERRKQYRKNNNEKIKESRREHYKNNKDLYKERSWKNAGILDMTIEKYNALLEKQNYSCCICNTHQNNLKRKLNVDHDHLTGLSRGLLCDSCNRALGYLKESVDIIDNLKKYIICHKEVDNIG